MVILGYFSILYFIGRISKREECHCIPRHIIPILFDTQCVIFVALCITLLGEFGKYADSI
jgi:hypothetical protein